MEAPKTVYGFEKHLDGWLATLAGPSPTGLAKWTPQFLVRFTVLFFMLLLALVFWPNNFFDPDLVSFTLTLGSLGLWRFGWWFTHAIRAEIYTQVKWQKMRAKASEVW